MSKPSKRMCEFCEKISKLCWEYDFEIWPTDEINITDSFGNMPTFTIHDMKTKEKLKLARIDGDDGGTCLDLNEIERIDE